VDLDHVETIVDVGANAGIFTALAAAKWPDATIYAFEPSEHMRKFIAMNNPNGKVNVQPFAVSDRDADDVAFYINPRGEQTNSLLHDAVDKFKPSNGQPIKVERIRSVTLDSFAASHEITNIDVLKVDIQGGESRLLSGAKRLLAKVRCALFEVSFLDPDPLEILTILNASFGRTTVVNLVTGGADLAFAEPKSVAGQLVS
jgi:FkbM family methyltransferase